MKKYSKYIYLAFFIFLVFQLVYCNKDPMESKSGVISVSVIDNNTEETPVPDVEITITPGNIVKTTDANGLCSFEVGPGEYYVDAEVCCIGPGDIQYHELVAISENETTEVKLLACL